MNRQRNTSSNVGDKKKRKPRTVKNAYIDISNILVDCGDDYNNWISIAKEKLKEREYKLLEIRAQAIRRIVKEKSCIQNGNEIIPSQFFGSCLRDLYELIDCWKGVKLSKLSSHSSSTDSFKNYFSVAKNWWDQKKKKKYGELFWCGVFSYIQQFNQSRYNNNVIKQRCCIYQTLRKLLDGKVQYSNTKQQPLIPIGTLKNCKYIKEYLHDLDRRLDIDKWIRTDIMEQQLNDKLSNNKKTIRTGNAKHITVKLKNELDVLINNCFNKLHVPNNESLNKSKQILCLWNTFMEQQQLTNNIPIVIQNQNHNHDPHNRVYNNGVSQYNYNYIVPAVTTPTMPIFARINNNMNNNNHNNNHNNINNNNSVNMNNMLYQYHPFHLANQSVFHRRFTPY